jgi:hypothetical protein
LPPPASSVIWGGPWSLARASVRRHRPATSHCPFRVPCPFRLLHRAPRRLNLVRPRAHDRLDLYRDLLLPDVHEREQRSRAEQHRVLPRGEQHRGRRQGNSAEGRPGSQRACWQCPFVLALDGGAAVPFAASAGRGASGAKRQGTAPQKLQRPPPSSRQHRLLLAACQPVKRTPARSFFRMALIVCRQLRRTLR